MELPERAALSRELGRIEGALEGAKKRSAKVAQDPYVKVSRDDLSVLMAEVEKQASLPDASSTEAFKAALQSLKGIVTAFFARFASPSDDYLDEEEHLVFTLEAEKGELIGKDKDLEARLEKGRIALMKAREASMAYDETSREQRHRVLEMAETKARQEAAVAREEARIHELSILTEELRQEKTEAVALGGAAALSYVALTELPQEERRTQEDRKRQVERLKIRVEEAGGGGEEVRGELQKTFSEGLAKVNTSFSEFFGLMFGGGNAKLVLEEIGATEEEDEEFMVEEQPKAKQVRAGIEISVALPKKRVQSLMQLSGGERALTSIALIFAMSQVNPPPFLILDETDAALDEANSRRYGDMIEELAKKSQLIVISHNRETMSRAGILYGVTMGADGISKLLSVKFEEAAAVAK